MKNRFSLLTIAYLLALQVLQAAPRCHNSLDEQFTALPSWLSLEDNKSEGLDLSCIEYSMNIFAGWAQTLDQGQGQQNGLFISCQEGSLTRSYTPQCQTSSYMQTTLNTFNSITDCLDIDSQKLYAIIASESGFYHNAVSSSLADFGFGQVTDPAITDVNSNWYYFIDNLKDSSKRSCQNIVRYIEKNAIEPVEGDYHCSLTQANSNPLLNALYTGIHYKLISGYMEDYSKRTDLQEKIENILGKNFTLERFKEIKEILIALSYNLGHNGTVEAFEQFINQSQSYLNSLLDKRRIISKELAATNLAILKTPESFSLNTQKQAVLKRLLEVDKLISYERHPSLFNGDNTPYSFGAFIQEANISHYLKVLKRRMKNIGLADRGNLCPTRHFLQVK